MKAPAAMRAPRRLFTLASAALLASIPARGVAQSGGSIELTVVDASTGAPLPSAIVRVDGSVRAESDADGRVRIDGLAPGLHQLLVSIVGYQSASPGVELARGQRMKLDVALDPAPVLVDTLVAEFPSLHRDRGVSTRGRRGHNGGRVISRSEIARLGATQLAELLVRAGVPGIATRSSSSDPACTFSLYADGLLLSAANLSLFPVQDLESVEVYSPATVPAEYASAGGGCGTIVVWTRHK